MAVSLEAALESTWNFCVERRWTGWDPYDGLMVTRAPFVWVNRSRWGRLALIQAMKRSPVNLRPLLGVPRLRNPKALALGLMAASRLWALPHWRERAEAEAKLLVSWLLDAATQTEHGHGWGYPFDWQARSFFIGRGVPTVVCTGFVVRALDHAHRRRFVDARAAIEQACRFIEHDLQRTEMPEGFCWSYSPLDRSVVVNATLLGAESLARLAALVGDPASLHRAKPTIDWALSQQTNEGGWVYGEAEHHRWEDAFHTGFNIVSLRAVAAAAQQLSLDPNEFVPQQALARAEEHYANKFFDPDGRPWYYRHTPWPIDGHAAAVAIQTLTETRRRDAAKRTLEWTLSNLWNERGWFDFQLHRRYRIRIPYLRWTQAWMLAALAEYISSEAES